MLSLQQIEILQALVNRLIPPDEDVGGWEAGVGEYLFRQFETDLKHLLPLYLSGLDGLDKEAQFLHHQPFAQLSPELQDDLLTQIEAGRVSSMWLVEPRLFFRLAAEHCAEGYYSDPGQGGNKGGVSWTMIGFQVRG